MTRASQSKDEPDYDELNRSAEALFGFAYNDPAGARREACVEAADLIRAAAHELHRLRALIDDAPHEERCLWPYGEEHPLAQGSYCDCWKSEI